MRWASHLATRHWTCWIGRNARLIARSSSAKSAPVEFLHRIAHVSCSCRVPVKAAHEVTKFSSGARRWPVSLRLEISDALLDQETMSLPLGEDPFQKVDEPLSLMRVVASSQERSEPLLLINQPFSSTSRFAPLRCCGWL